MWQWEMHNCQNLKNYLPFHSSAKVKSSKFCEWTDGNGSTRHKGRDGWMNDDEKEVVRQVLPLI